MERANKKLKLGTEIGSGSFGSVHLLGTDKVVKVCHCDPSELVDYGRVRECAAMAVLNRSEKPHFARLLCTHRVSGASAMVLDRFDNNLLEQVKLTDERIRDVFFAVTNAVLYMHNRNLLHRDLKDRNVLVKGNCVSLCDFGSVTSTHSHSRHSAAVAQLKGTSDICTLTHRAPEIFLGAKDYTTAVDSWALGVILAEMYLGTALFWNYGEKHDIDSDDDTDEEVHHTFHNICKCFGLDAMQCLSAYPLFADYTAETAEFCPLLYHRGIGLSAYSQQRAEKRKNTANNCVSDDLARAWRPGSIPPDAIDLLCKLLAVNPAERWSVGQVIGHGFFQGRQPTESVVMSPVERVRLTDFSVPHEANYDRAAPVAFFRRSAKELQWRNRHTLFGAIDIAHRYIQINGSISDTELIGIGAIAESLFEVHASNFIDWLVASNTQFTQFTQITQFTQFTQRDIKRSIQRVEFTLKHDFLLATEWMYLLALFHNSEPSKESLLLAEDLLLASLCTQGHSLVSKPVISARIFAVVQQVFQ